MATFCDHERVNHESVGLSPAGPISLAASLHLDAATPNFLVQEQTAMGACVESLMAVCYTRPGNECIQQTQL